MKHTYQEAHEASLKYFKNDSLPADTFLTKYAVRDKENNYLELTPDDLHIRLSTEFARIDSEKYGLDFEKRYQIYLEAQKNFQRIIAQGSPMAAIGNNYQVMSASNCMVIDSPMDSIDGIMKTALEMAQLQKRRAGVGIDISTLRPTGFHVNNAARTTSGAPSFADLYSYVTRKIAQCLHESTNVLTKKGLKEIKNILPGEVVWTEKGWIKVNSVIENKKACVKLETKYGHEIICSEDHIFHTTDGEKKVKDLQVGSLITQIVGEGWEGQQINLLPPPIVRVGNNKSNRLNTNIKFPTKLDNKLAYIIGYSYGDGCVTYDEEKTTYEISLALDPVWEGIASKLEKYVMDVFDYDKKRTNGDGCKRLRLSSKLLILYLKNNGFLKQKAEQIDFPQKLLKAHSDIVFAFIAGYFDADGDVTKKKSYRFRSIRKEFLLDIQNIFYSHGIPSKIHIQEREEENWETIYTLSINGGLAQSNFRKYMQESVKVASVLPFIKIRDFTRTCYKVKDFDTNSSRHNYIMNNNQWIAYLTIQRLNKDLNTQLKPYLLQDTIKKIQPYKKEELQKVYDLVLESEHLFFANGLYAHNSGRRGALILTMDVHHPDVEEFATSKIDRTKVTGANISIRLSDEFLEAVEKDEDYEQRWPCEGEPVFTRQVSARKVWKTIINTATETAEPGLLFWDRIKSYLPAESYPHFKSISCNPCAELNLSAYDSCRLLALNLTSYVLNPFRESAQFDWKAFTNDVHLAMQMLDNIIDLELELVQRIMEKSDTAEEKELWQKFYQAGHDGRRTGLGTLGLADALAQLRIKYDSEAALEFADKLYRNYRDSAYEASIDLAEVRGPFPAFDWKLEKDNEFIKNLPEDLQKRMSKSGRRNISLLTLPPTGSIAILARCNKFSRHNISSGVEPLFKEKFKRRKKINESDDNAKVDFVDALGDKWQHYDIYHGNILNYMEEILGLEIGDLELPETQEMLDKAFKELPDYFVTADNIDWKFRVKLQGIIQIYTDHSISSTINLPKGTKPDIVSGIYFEAWKQGLKGVTVYVDGSRDGVLITEENEKVDPKVRPENIIRMQAPKRPKELPCEIHHHKYKDDRWVALVGLLNDEPYEMFAGHSDLVQIPKKCKKGKIVKSARGKYALHILIGEEEFIIKDIIKTFNDPELAWATRIVSMILRHGTPVDFLVEQLSKDGKINSFNKVLARVCKKYIKEGQKVNSAASCPECESIDLMYTEGCISCTMCPWTKC